ncbi:hypothetical protein DACRYDRAFT_24500 [Dacryopinax primogenitus]|uniref:Uncharacterized protein n=1 Tax=Dacryopinax primogenitus (strain DJM 731) TaxID=1858805 RepID=M5G3U9_DACPD|nr:uncharacterized protein DACRYDRAFT_24500 [Dacryopinax primogenitus]EJT98437.1 hypothetical protein DACRYDRAFT_24500 [Dacryopinax primogenitus]
MVSNLPPFGSFSTLCYAVPSYPVCNLFFHQLLGPRNSPQTIFPGQDTSNAVNLANLVSAAPVGINPECGIPRMHTGSSLGNIANIIACGLSIIATAMLILATGRRKAAVGRVELRTFLFTYLLTCIFQLLTTGSFLEQGSMALAIITSIHLGLVVMLFWQLLWNALVATQWVEDGTMSSLVPFTLFSICFFVAALYICLDTAFGFTLIWQPNNPTDLANLENITLFVFLDIWPPAAAFIFFVVMACIVMCILREVKPVLMYLLTAVLFVLSQLAYFLLNRIICERTSAKIDGSFVATILETLAVYALWGAWRSITEDSWEEPWYD